MEIRNVTLPFQDSSRTWNLRVHDGEVTYREPSVDSSTSNPPSVLSPSLCHAHIHLDKPYLLTCHGSSTSNHPDYSDLAPQSGSIDEALRNTSEAKKRYTEDDLYLRGSQLLATSYTQGVTSMRAFVEVDHVTGSQSLRTAIRLKENFAEFVDVQICAFAQDPIFSTEHGEQNRAILTNILQIFYSSIGVIGTTPYVEHDAQGSRRNIKWAVQTALHFGKHLDFHIEFNLKTGDIMDEFNYLIDTLIANPWPTYKSAPAVVLGHATRLSLASHAELRLLSERIRSASLPVHFIGLPTSDLYMMGRPASDNNAEQGAPLSRVCGTLHIPKLIQDYHLNGCMSVNNIGNAFTPHGDGNPLRLATWGVGLYHAGGVDSARLLYEAVSIRALEAIMPSNSSLLEKFTLRKGRRLLPMLLIRNKGTAKIASATGKTVEVQERQRLTIHDVVWDPPETRLRSIISSSTKYNPPRTGKISLSPETWN